MIELDYSNSASVFESHKNNVPAGIEADAKYLNPDLPIEERVEDLIQRMTPDEKASQMLNDAPAIERLGVPRYEWWSEALHGIARAGKATVFPQAINLGATFDPELIHRVAAAISDEGRAKHHAAANAGNRGRSRGLTFWSPTVNLIRDPRWGRGHESYGEDPYHLGVMGTAFVRGMQGDDARGKPLGKFMKVGACAKHYAVHSGPEGDRHKFNAIASKKDMHETYLPHFKALVTEGKVESVMGAYNRTNDEPCCAHSYLMQDVLRGQWDFRGHFVSDCWAIRNFHEDHAVTKTLAESAALGVKMSCDLNCGCSYEHLDESLEQGLLEEADLDKCLRRLFTTRFKLGMFDPPETVEWTKIGLNRLHCEDHIDLAREAAEKSLVLLQNKRDALPLTGKEEKMLVLGFGAADVDILLGNYFGSSDRLVTILEGISARAPESTTVEYLKGVQLSTPNVNPVDWSIGNAAKCDHVIVCLGVSPLLEGEEGESIASPDTGDRFNLGLPEHQKAYLKRLRDKTKEGDVKLTLVLSSGSAICDPELGELADAILWMGYPGEQGGHAVARALYGDINPGGKLPMTWYQTGDDLPEFTDYNMYPQAQGGLGKGRTYRYFTGDTWLPFGHGLSYTKFEYSGAKLDGDTVTVIVKNTGEHAGDEVVQAFVSLPDRTVPTPIRSLAAFDRVTLQPGESKTVTLQLHADLLKVVQEDGSLKSEPGKLIVHVGDQSLESSL